MSFHRVLTGSGMKASKVQLYKNVAQVLETGYAESKGYISAAILHCESDKIEYGQYLNAIARLLVIIKQSSGVDYQDIENFGGIAVDKDHDVIYAEYCDATASEFANEKDFSKANKTLLKIGLSNFSISANTINGQTGEVGRYTPCLNKPKTGERTGAAALFAYLVWLSYAEMPTNVESHLQRELVRACAGQDESLIYDFIVDLQSVIRYAEELEDKGYPTPNFDAIQPMMPSFIVKDEINFDYNELPQTFGSFDGFEKAWGLQDANNDAGAHLLKDLVGKFDFDPQRERTSEEKRILNDMRKSLDGEMYVSDTLIDIATDIKLSTNMRFKFRDYMLKGPTGTGKTTMCKVLGLLLNLPVVTFSCDPDTDQLALGCSVIPNAKSDDEEITKIDLQSFMDTMPCFDDLIIDPCMSFKQITGTEKADATSDDCIAAILKKWGEVSEKQANGFRYVYSNIAKAMKYGWVVEVQEPTVIQRPGVLTALNALTDDCGKLDLANGETIYRHPDAIMIYTTNLNLEGCFEMNQSQKSRFSQRTIELPSEEELVQRLMQSTGYTNEDVAKKMVKVYTLADNYAKSKAICDGAIDFRALQAWATANMIRKTKVYENGITEFIEKCTDDPAQKAIFITSCLENQFAPSKVTSKGIKDLRRKKIRL